MPLNNAATNAKKPVPPKAHPYKKIIDKNSLFWYGSGMLDYLNVSLMYGMYATPALTAWFLSSLIVVIYPLFFAFRLIDAYCAWVHAIHDYNRNNGIKAHNLLNAIVTTLTVILVGVAVGATLMGYPAMISTIMFGANLVLMAGFRLIVGIYEAGKASVAARVDKQDPLSQKPYSVRSISQFAMFAFLAMTASAGICINLFGIAFMWPLGVIGGLLGASLCAYGVYSIWKTPEHQPKMPIPGMEVDNSVEETELVEINTTTKELTKALGQVIEASAKEVGAEPSMTDKLLVAAKAKITHLFGVKGQPVKGEADQVALDERKINHAV